MKINAFLLTIFSLLLAACAPTATAQPTITAAPASGGKAIALLITRVPKATATVTPTPSITPIVTPTATEVPATLEPTATAQPWISPDAVEGEQPDCHQKDDGHPQYPVAHLSKTQADYMGCHLTVTLGRPYQQVVLLQPGTLNLELEVIFVDGQIQNPEHIPATFIFMKVDDGFWIASSSDHQYDVRFFQADNLGDLKKYVEQ